MQIPQELIEDIKEKRNSVKLSLEKVSEETKIPVPELKAIEEGNIEYFGNSFYARSFIKQYTAYLGIEFDEGILRSEEVPEIQEIYDKPAPVCRISRPYAAILVLIIAVIYLGPRFLKSDFAERFRSIKPRALKETTAALPIKGVVSAPAPLLLRCEAREDTWIRVTADGSVIEEKIILAGSSPEYEAKKSLKIRVGNVNGVKVLYKKSSSADFIQLDIVEGNKGDINEMEITNDFSQLYYAN